MEQSPCSFTGHLRVLFSSAERDSSSSKPYRPPNFITDCWIRNQVSTSAWYSFATCSHSPPKPLAGHSDGAEPPAAASTRALLPQDGSSFPCTEGALLEATKSPKAERRRLLHPQTQHLLVHNSSKAAQQRALSSSLQREAFHVTG